MSIRLAGARLLNRRGGRWLLGGVASAWLRATGERCTVRFENGIWTHRYRDFVLPHPRVIPPISGRELVAEAEGIFLHRYTPSQGDVVFDVGAGLGSQTLVFSRLVGESGRVVAIEAHPRTAAMLRRMCQLNGLQNVTVVEAAASDSARDLRMSDSETYETNGLSVDGAITVNALPLDAIAADLGITAVSLLAMNIEGAETAALVGAQHLLGATQRVCISCHDFLADAGGPESMRTKNRVCAQLTARGFTLSDRPDATDAWTRYYVYGLRQSTNAISA